MASLQRALGAPVSAGAWPKHARHSDGPPKKPAAPPYAQVNNTTSTAPEKGQPAQGRPPPQGPPPARARRTPPPTCRGGDTHTTDMRHCRVSEPRLR